MCKRGLVQRCRPIACCSYCPGSKFPCETNTRNLAAQAPLDRISAKVLSGLLVALLVTSNLWYRHRSRSPTPVSIGDYIMKCQQPRIFISTSFFRIFQSSAWRYPTCRLSLIGFWVFFFKYNYPVILSTYFIADGEFIALLGETSSV